MFSFASFEGGVGGVLEGAGPQQHDMEEH